MIITMTVMEVMMMMRGGWWVNKKIAGGGESKPVLTPALSKWWAGWAGWCWSWWRQNAIALSMINVDINHCRQYLYQYSVHCSTKKVYSLILLPGNVWQLCQSLFPLLWFQASGNMVILFYVSAWCDVNNIYLVYSQTFSKDKSSFVVFFNFNFLS